MKTEANAKYIIQHSPGLFVLRINRTFNAVVMTTQRELAKEFKTPAAAARWKAKYMNPGYCCDGSNAWTMRK